MPSATAAPVVLLYEDDDTLQEVLRECLTEEGIEVLVCDSAEALLACAEAGRAVAAVVDSFGPHPASLEPAERTQLEGLAQTVPTILTSGRSWARQLQAGDLGLAAVQPKPFDLNAFCRTVLNLVNRYNDKGPRVVGE